MQILTLNLLFLREGGENMSIQPISNGSNSQYVSPLTSDFNNIQDDIKALETAQKLWQSG